MAERKRAIQADMMLSIIRKCDLTDVSRSTMYHQPVERELDLEEPEIKKGMDKLHIKYPFMDQEAVAINYGSKDYYKPEARPNTHGCYEYSFNCS